MQSPIGHCFIEYIWPARGPRPEVLERFPFWSPERDVAYFRGLAHAGIRNFYRGDHPKREQILVDGVSREVTAQAVRLVDENGREMCRWTASDEYEELSHARH
ncbi:MAG TPA: hypothetical protein VL996_09185 [Methylocella sp.]|nr:hypothetical protein [Methylocella sp.]